MTTPVIRAKLPDGRVGSAEGALAPDLARAQLSLDLAAAGEGTDTRWRSGRPVFAIHEVKAAEADDLLVDWGHPLGGINPGKKGGRPFGYAAYVYEALGRPVTVLISASSPNASVSKDHGLHRWNTVELARVGRPDSDAQATLAAVRLWSVYLAPLWPERYPDLWPHGLDAAISYSLPGTPSAQDPMKGMYHRLGWKNLGKRHAKAPSTRSRSNQSKTDFIADGVKGLWIWEYTRGVHVPIDRRPNPIETIAPPAKAPKATVASCPPAPGSIAA